MRRFITRHGQVPDGTAYDGGHLFPLGESLISERGAEQAHRLGIRLRCMNFKGVILCSPFIRTLLTAEIIAEETGTEIVPFAPIHEIIRSEKTLKNYRGMSKEQISEKIRHLAKDFELDYPWWSDHLESQDDVEARVAEGVKLAESLYGDREILYVAHGASTTALENAYDIPRGVYPLLFNCALSYVDDTAPKIKRVHGDTDHLPYEMTTSNFVKKSDWDVENMHKIYEEEISLPDWVTDRSGEILLHIGDTYSKSYPFYKALIDKVKPNVILHTGDMADEVKVGRKPFTKSEYLNKISVICSTLDKSDAERLIIVPGNNDLKDDISALVPRAQIYSEDTVITLGERECRIGHSVLNMTFDKEWSFYGHGYTGETWDYENNRIGGECRFNACSHSYVVDLKFGRFFRLTP